MSTRIAIAVALIVIDPSGSFVLAQTSLGGPEQLPPSIAPTPPPLSPPANPPASSPPRMDYIPPMIPPKPAPNQPSTTADFYWGAIAFTADGSYSSVWKKSSQPDLRECARFGRGGC